VTGSDITDVVVAAGGLGTRVDCWARFIPKEFYPVDGRPGIVHLLEEVAALGPARVIIVYHPYYEGFAAWARNVLSEEGQARYARSACRAFGTSIPAGLSISFVPQRGRYADLTSVINGADYLFGPAELYVAFADNLYGRPGPLLALRGAPPGQVAVLASPYRPELAGRCGVITATGKRGQRLMASLAERPSPAEARALERRHGRGNLLLLEGRARVTADFVRFARARMQIAGTEPKLALTLADYALVRQVHIVETSSSVTDLGALAARSHTVAATSTSALGERSQNVLIRGISGMLLPGARHRQNRHRCRCP
jgi:UTP-glucose-1-phosphate uridylyltransferase